MMDDLRSVFALSSVGLDAQYHAANDAVIALDRSELRRVAVRGADSESFLHNMLTADVKRMGSGSGCAAAFLTNKGKLVASFILLREDERFVLEVESEREEALIAALSRYVISEDVSLVSTDDVSFSLEGPDAPELISKLMHVDVDGLAHLAFVSKDGVHIIARRRDPSARFDVVAEPSRALELLEAARAEGAVIGSAELAELRRIEAGRPRFGVDFDESRMPLEAGLDDAISFDKGCYIGQEYVVRLAHRGHLNQKLVGIRIETNEPPPSGTSVLAGEEEAGVITSAAFSPKLGAVVALGYLRREAFAPGTAVIVAGKNGVVTDLPFL